MSSLQACEFVGCDRTADIDLCKGHLQQRRRSGCLQPIGIRHGTVPLAERFWSKVARGADCWEWQGAMRPQGYGAFFADGLLKYAHRIAWELEHAEPIPDGLVIDHICFNRKCVRPSHLRATTTQLNVEYRHRGTTKVPVSGVRGVYRNRDKWLARVKHKGVVHNMGTFSIREDAIRAVTAKRHELFQFPEFQGAIK